MSGGTIVLESAGQGGGWLLYKFYQTPPYGAVAIHWDNTVVHPAAPLLGTCLIILAHGTVSPEGFGRGVGTCKKFARGTPCGYVVPPWAYAHVFILLLLPLIPGILYQLQLLPGGIISGGTDPLLHRHFCLCYQHFVAQLSNLLI